MTDINKESWDLHAEKFYIENYLSLEDVDFESYDYPTEKDLNIIGDVKDLNVLEIGSGTCNCGIALAKKGANVTCLDISQQQLKIGKKVAEKASVDISFICSSMTDLSQIESNSIDLVISMSAIMYVNDFNKVCFEVSKVLKKNGKFIFSTTHPIIMCIGATELWPEEKANPNYNYRGAIEWKWNENDDYYFTNYRLQMSDYVNILANNNLMIERMEELFPVTDDFDERELKIRQRFPSVLVIKAKNRHLQ